MEMLNINNILVEYEKITAEYEKKKIEGEEFNVFHLINDIYGIGETKHSRFLAFLLNPRGEHGQGKLFLNLFLNELKIDFDHKNSEWIVTAEKDNADILIQSNFPTKISVVIENKSNDAVDQRNQLYRYWYRHIYKFYDDGSSHFDDIKHCRIVYLTEGNWKTYIDDSITKPKKSNDEEIDEYFIKYQECPVEELDKNFITCWTYLEHIDKWLNECISDEKNIPSRIRCFIEDYIKFWQDTKLKDEFYMDRYNDYFKGKEQDWINFFETKQHLENLKNRWTKNFISKLNDLRLNWIFNYYLEKDGGNEFLNYDDFRWSPDEKSEISFVYEFQEGLTIWKDNFKTNKINYKDELEELFKDYFEFVPENSNYAMRLKDEWNSKIIFRENESSKIAWNLGNNSSEITRILNLVLKRYIPDNNVNTLFAKINNSQ
ncbi:hypothetical protein D3C87_486310 [compost metagenome]